MDAHHSPRDRGRPLPVTVAQIVALGLVAASVGWAVWLTRERPETDEVALLEDTVLTAGQLATIEASLDRANLTDYRTEAGRVWVPRARQSAYKRAVVDADAVPKPWGARLHEAVSAGGVWASPAARAESLRIALQDELSLVLCSMPGIERASVLYDVEERSGFQQEPLKTASVGVRMSADCELDAVRANGIRVLVASSIAGLKPERVAVTDLGTGHVHAGPIRDDAEGLDPLLARRMAQERALAGKVRQALAFVRGAIVDVALDTAASDPGLQVPADGADRAVAPRDVAAANAPAELLPPAPPASDRPVAPGPPDSGAVVHVTVSVPDSWLEAAVAAGETRARRGSDDASPPAAEAEAREMERLRGLVARALPAFDAPGRLRILVTSHPVTDVASSAARGGSNRAAVEAAAAADPVGRLASPAPVTLESLPREVWLAATSILVGLLAGFLWWAGSRDVAHDGEAEPSGPTQGRVASGRRDTAGLSERGVAA